MHLKKFMIFILLSPLFLSACGKLESSKNAQSQDIFVSECGYGYAKEPSEIILTCADAGIRLTNLTFTNWSKELAKGSGSLVTNDCNPNCAEGSDVTYPVEITLSVPKNDSNGKLIFSRLDLVSSKTLYNGKKSATFDIGYEPDNYETVPTDSAPASKDFTPEEAVADLLSRLNSDNQLWQINEMATSQAGQYQHKRLGLYSEPEYVIECNVRMSGTWLFIYTDDKSAYDAFGSDYFFRTSAYSAEITYDPVTNLIVILHTSMGGNKSCIDSAFSQLEYYGTD